MDDSTQQTAHLNPSELGTKEYWDNLYARELQNHTEDGEDEGTIWFDESNAEATVIRELDALVEERLLEREHSTFLDLGTGNGHMLFALRYREDDEDDEDAEVMRWRGEMVGVDYSSASVDLARRIAAQRHDREGEASAAPLRFESWDILTQPPGPWLPSAKDSFDVVHDKGTFDAISLMSTAEGAQHPCRTYREKVVPLIREGGILVITSCNWTRDELMNWLVEEKGGGGLELYREAHYPSFTFGGKKGQSVVTLIFRRRSAM